MDRKPSSNFDQIKPFLKMLERSIDDARHRRLGDDGNESTASSAPSTPSSNSGPGSATRSTDSGAERPVRATPIRPKTQIRPPGFIAPSGA